MERGSALNPIEWSSNRVINRISHVWLVNYSLVVLWPLSATAFAEILQSLRISLLSATEPLEGSILHLGRSVPEFLFWFHEGDLVIRPTNLPLRFFRRANSAPLLALPRSCFLPSGVFLVLSMLVTIILAAVRARHAPDSPHALPLIAERWYNGPAEIFGAAITNTSKHVLYMVIVPLSSDPSLRTFPRYPLLTTILPFRVVEEVWIYRNVI